MCNTVAYLLRRDMMTKAVVDTKALQVVSQENMLENLLHSEVKPIQYNIILYTHIVLVEDG